MKVAVIGTGSWGTAIAQVLVDNGHDTIMYGIDKQEVEDINNGCNTKFFKDLKINPDIKATIDLQQAIEGVSAIVLVVPTKVISTILNEIAELLVIDRKIYFINASKGFDPETNDCMSNTIRKIIPSKNRHEVASIIGPSHAEEVILRWYTTIASVSIDIEVAQHVQKLFSNEYIRLYTLEDEVGAEYGVAIKNVLALCSGIVSGIGLGDNTRAALLTRGLHEMIKYGVAKGGRMETYLGLTGIGDLIVTATSQHSRNFQAGYKIGQEGGSTSVMEDSETTIEGVRTCKVIYEDSHEIGVELPIINECYKVLYENGKPKDAIDRLMRRELKSER